MDLEVDKMEAQVKADHYDFSRYIRSTSRWDSYYYQLKYSLESDARDVLLIGPGDNIVPNLLRFYDKNLTTFDIAEDLNPDIVGDICELDTIVSDSSYDCIVCCEVCEHIPFEKFEGIINNFSKALRSDGKLVFSVPRGGIQ